MSTRCTRTRAPQWRSGLHRTSRCAHRFREVTSTAQPVGAAAVTERLVWEVAGAAAAATVTQASVGGEATVHWMVVRVKVAVVMV